MKAGPVIAVAGAGVLLYTVLSKRATLSTLNFYPSSVKNIHFDNATPVMTIGLACQNTSNQKLVIRSIAGNLSANVNGTNYDVGNISNFQEQTVQPNSQTEILIDVRLALIGVVNDLIRALQFGNFSQELRLQAYANIDRYQVPIDLKFKIGA